MIDDAGRQLSTAPAPVVRGDREDLILRIGQVVDTAGQEGLGCGDHVQRLPHQLDPAVLGHETGSEQVMEGAPGRLRRRVGHVFGEHLLRGVDQDVDVLGREAEVQVEPGERGLELADRLATPVAPRDPHRMQERQFERPVLGEQGGGVLAVRDGGEEFDQQGLGVLHCDGLSEPGVTSTADAP